MLFKIKLSIQKAHKVLVLEREKNKVVFNKVLILYKTPIRVPNLF